MKELSERFLFDSKTQQILVRVGKVEIGQHVHSGFQKIVAAGLDIDVSRIKLCAISTQRSPNDGLTAGSLSMQTTGAQLRTAAIELRKIILVQAARQLNSDIQTISLDGKSMEVASNTQRCSLFSLPIAKLSAHTSSSNDDVHVDATIPASIQGKRLYIQDIVVPGMLHARATRGRDTSRCDSNDARLITDGRFSALIAESEVGLERAWSNIEQKLPMRDTSCDGAISHWIHDRIVHTEQFGDTTAISSAITQNAQRPFIMHASIAPSCAIARFKNGILELWTHSQGIFPLRDTIADQFKLAVEHVIVRHVPSAGTYGHSGADDAAMDAAMISLQTDGTPVRVAWTRQDDFQFAPVGAAMYVKVEAKLDQNNSIESWRQTIWSAPHGQRPGGGGNVNLRASIEKDHTKKSTIIPDLPRNAGGGAARNAMPPYSIASYGETTHLVQDLPVHTSSIRGLGAQVNVLSIEATMDKLALSCAMDPIDFRIRHVEDPRAREVLFRLQSTLAEASKDLQDEEAIGISYSRYKNKAAYAAVAAKVRLVETVELLDVWTVVDAGCIVDESGAINQIEGGIIQAASWTICEGALLRDGYIDATSWDDYPILGWKDIPDIHTTLVNNHIDEPSLGIGECMVGPVSAAIVNGVSKIIGFTLADLPLTREKFIASTTNAN